MDTSVKSNEKIKMLTWFLALYLLLAPLDFLPVIPGISFARILMIIPMSACLLYLKDSKVVVDKYLMLLISYVLLAMLSTYYSGDPEATMQRIMTIGMNIAAIIVLSLPFYNGKEVNLLTKAIVFSGIFTLILMYIYSSTAIDDGRLTVIVNGFAQDPNYLTGYLIFGIVYYYEKLINKRSVTAFLILVAFLVFILLTGSRGGLLGVFAAVVAYSIMRFTNDKAKISSTIALIMGLLLLLISYNVAMERLPENITQRYTYESVMSRGGSGRADLWKDAVVQYAEFPVFNKVFGGGAGTIWYYMTSSRVSHNVWLDMLIELGVLGVMTLFLLYASFLGKAYRMKQNVAASAFIGYIVMGMTLSIFSYKPIWNVMLLIMIAKNYEKAEKINPNSDNDAVIVDSGWLQNRVQLNTLKSGKKVNP